MTGTAHQLNLIAQLGGHFAEYAPAPRARDTEQREVVPKEGKFTGFVFRVRPFTINTLILGAVGILQFGVAAHRLRCEYGVGAVVEPIGVQAARWVIRKDDKALRRFRDKAYDNLAEDGDGQLVYLAPTRENVNLTMERWPDIQFLATRALLFSLVSATTKHHDIECLTE